MAKNFVYVYKGLGNSERSHSMLTKTVMKMLENTQYTFKYITPEEIIKDDWPSRTALMIFGGGYDRGFISALGEKGMDRIRQYVIEGGSYWGMCAGGYFGCSHIEFDKGGSVEVCGDRPLKFFQGKCVGPCFPGFKYSTNHGTHAARIVWNISDSFCKGGQQNGTTKKLETFSYFNGGGSFHPVGNDKLEQNDIHYEWDVFATYSELPGCPAGAIKSKIGKGRAILCGMHVEYIPEELDPEDPVLQSVIPKLAITHKTTETVLKIIFTYLGLTLDSS